MTGWMSTLCFPNNRGKWEGLEDLFCAIFNSQEAVSVVLLRQAEDIREGWDFLCTRVAAGVWREEGWMGGGEVG